MTPEESIAYALDFDLLFSRIVGGPPDKWQSELGEAATSDDEHRILACCGRQTGKSSVVSVLAARQAIFVPNSLTVIASGSLQQSQELGRLIFAGIKKLEPNVKAENLTRIELLNRSRIVCVPQADSSRGLSGVGLCVVDEAQDVDPPLFASLEPTQACAENPKLIVLGTTKVRQGKFFEYYQSGNFKVFEVRTDSCPRVSKQFLSDQLKALGPQIYASEYENVWLDTGAAMLSSSLLEAAVSTTYVPMQCR